MRSIVSLAHVTSRTATTTSTRHARHASHSTIENDAIGYSKAIAPAAAVTVKSTCASGCPSKPRP